MPSKSPDEQSTSPARLEAFSDGVIAVILTIMVLDLKLPATDGLRGLQSSLPDLGVYLLSFVFTGIYWLNHQHLVQRLDTAGYWLFVSNLSFLFFLSLLPFSTRYLIAHGATVYSVQQYAATLALVAAAFYAVRLSVHKHLRLRHSLTVSDDQDRSRHLWSLVGYLLTIPIATWGRGFALAVIVAQTLVWGTPWNALLPGKSRRAEPPQ